MKHKHTRGKTSANSTSSHESASEVPSSRNLDRARRHIADRHYQQAIDLLNTSNQDSHARNLIGVCLMRVGNFGEAARVLRKLVLQPGATWMRRDIPNVYKSNFATALLLDGHPAGCLEMLAELNDPSSPAGQRLRAAIRQWEKTLSFSAWLNWRFGRIEPSGFPVQLDFEPGEFETQHSPGEPPQTPPTTSPRNAA
ncbi:MAG: tetratricopeptide repeat protein [Pirellulaceae bacterium]